VLCIKNSSTSRLEDQPIHAHTTQCKALKIDLLKSVWELKRWNHIFGPVPSLEELLDPVEEEEIGESPYSFDEIVKKVHHKQAVACGEIVEIGSDKESDDDEDKGQGLTIAEMIHMCKQLKSGCLESPAKSSLEMLQVSH
jgi:hypothetical protein